MKKTAIIPCVTIIAGGLTAGIATAPAALAATGTDVYVGCVEHGQRPSHISLSCADDAVSFDGITWSSWTSGRATGVGTFSYNTCLPTCVDGNTVVSKQVKITLSKPKVVKGVRFFSALTANYPHGNGPAGMLSSTFAPYTPTTQQ